MVTFIDLLPLELIRMIDHHKAAIIIQEQVFKKFYKTYGPTWKEDVKNQYLSVYDYDYYCYKNNIADPWHDYCDELEYRYG